MNYLIMFEGIMTLIDIFYSFFHMMNDSNFTWIVIKQIINTKYNKSNGNLTNTSPIYYFKTIHVEKPVRIQ